MSSARRYGTALAATYDALSDERLLYRAGRREGVRALALRPGERVLDLGCGTGLSLPLLVGAVGERGRVVGLDASAAMLARAGRRVAAAGWRQVALVRADAAHLDPVRLAALTGPTPQAGGPDGFDAVLACYCLSLLPDPAPAWRALPRLLAPAGRVAVVDLALTRGWALPLAPLAALACALGGSDPRAHPWEALTGTTAARELRGGHVRVRVGGAGPRVPG
ncbi:class I SAM-dependent methyltransferase [Quadrisphaera sp. KR29]|uniref:class I SAM-dependent methyltransferase n=1 Tax=Quadrisphaera sp. KR29 TaxID=3461391 RepID=UPI00404407AC